MIQFVFLSFAKLLLSRLVGLLIGLISNPKQATKRVTVWWLFSCLSGVSVVWAQPGQFVSLSLCSDRLLFALAKPEQIAAMSTYSTDPLAMLSQVNTDKPTVRPVLSDLLPYMKATFLLNETFYPHLLARMKTLGFTVFAINDNPQTPKQLFALIRQLSAVTGQVDKGEALIARLLSFQKPSLRKQVLLLSENGYLNYRLPQFNTLFKLMNYQSVNNEIDSHHPAVALEEMLLTDPQIIVKIHRGVGYSAIGQWLSHPALNTFSQGRTVLDLPTQYTYCFDHGVWQGADYLRAQQR